MPTREDLLRELTFKGDVDDLERRVFYTLTGKEALQAHRVAKALTLVVKFLYDRGLLDDDALDGLLLEAVL